MEAFRYLNPFENSSVHEDDVWGEQSNAAFDVESIHADVSCVLLDDLQHVAATGRTRVRFLVGPPGVGKSHLFSRLHRQIGGQTAFAFASIPPTRPAALPRWVLERVISGLQHKRLVDGGLRSYAQLDALIYRLLMENDPILRNETEDVVREVVTEAGQRERNQYLNNLRNELVGPDFNDELVGALLDVLRPESRRLALRWLSGTANLTEDDLASIGHANPLDDSGVHSLLVLLGRLANLAKLPIVLVLDQLDLMTEPAQIDAFQDLIFTLVDKSYGWYVVTALLRERYEAWLPRFNLPLETRLKAQSGGAMPTIELWLISDKSQKQALLAKRLVSNQLAAARTAHGITSQLYPLVPADIKQLVSNVEPAAPRALLTRAAAVFDRRVRGAEEIPPARRPLAEVIRAEFETRRARISEDSLSVDRAAIADRVAELVRLVALDMGISGLASTVGPLEGTGPGAGTHSIFSSGALALEVLGHHMQRGAAFPNFATRALGLEPGAIFIRAASANISGTKSIALFKQVCERHIFVSLTNPVLADLEALIHLLADMRAGDLRLLDTEPSPTDEAILQAASQLPFLATLPLAQAVRERLSGRSTVVPKEGPQPHIKPPPSIEGSGPDPVSLASKVREIMRPLRWLALERLRWLLRRHHQINLTTDALARLLRSEPYESMFEFYPPTVLTPGLPQILIFVEDDRA